MAEVRRYHPRALALLGISAYRTAFARPHAVLGRQPEEIDGTQIWVLPNPSGLNAHFQVAELAEWYRRVGEGVHEHCT